MIAPAYARQKSSTSALKLGEAGAAPCSDARVLEVTVAIASLLLCIPMLRRLG